jgi:hypothetical protein
MGKLKVLFLGKWIAGIIAGLIVVAVLGLASLMVFGTASRPQEMMSVSNSLRLVDFSDLPTLQQFKARDGQALNYRLYPGTGRDVVVLIHGSSGESSGMHAVAKSLSDTGYTVYVPDLRGHGHDGRAGDIDYIGQLDNDLVDLVGVIVRAISTATSSWWATPPVAALRCALPKGRRHVGSIVSSFCRPRSPMEPRPIDPMSADGRSRTPAASSR